jgi:hypothetical protein
MSGDYWFPERRGQPRGRNCRLAIEIGTLDQTHREQPLLEPPLEHPGLQHKTYNTAVMHEPCHAQSWQEGNFWPAINPKQKSAF